MLVSMHKEIDEQICDFLFGVGSSFAGSILLITRERDMDIIFTCPSCTLKKSKARFPEIGTEKKSKAVASGNTSGSTLLRLGGQVTEPPSLFAV